MYNVRCSEVFGKNLRKLRMEQGLTRLAFVSQFDGNTSTLQGYESGRKMPGFKAFISLCNASGYSPNELLDGLYPWKTELDLIREMQTLPKDLTAYEQNRLDNLLRIAKNSMLETPPLLSNTSFGGRLQLMRMDAQMDIAELATRCSIAVSTLQGYESGQYRPGIPIVLKLCELYGVSPSFLLAPELTIQLYQDPQVVSLRPRQIKMLVDIERYFVSSSLRP